MQLKSILLWHNRWYLCDMYMFSLFCFMLCVIQMCCVLISSHSRAFTCIQSIPWICKSCWKEVHHQNAHTFGRLTQNECVCIKVEIVWKIAVIHIIRSFHNNLWWNIECFSMASVYIIVINSSWWKRWCWYSDIGLDGNVN